MPYIVFVKENSCLPHRPRTETSAHTGQPLTPGAVIDPQGILGIWENTEYIHQSHTTPHSHRSLDFQGRLLLYCVVKVEHAPAIITTLVNIDVNNLSTSVTETSSLFPKYFALPFQTKPLSSDVLILEPVLLISPSAFTSRRGQGSPDTA